MELRLPGLGADAVGREPPAHEAGLDPDDVAGAYRLGAATFGAANDLGRIGRAEEVAVMAALLCSPLAGFTVGATIPVDGGTDFF